MLEMFEPWLIAPIAALISILAGLYFYRYVDKQDSGTERMKEISEAIKEGSKAFLKREYTKIASIVYSLFRKAFEPSLIALEISFIRSVPESCLST